MLNAAAAANMRPAELLRRRLDNQWLASPRAATPGELAEWMVALQAQDYPGAKWSIGLRLRGVTDDDVERAISAARDRPQLAIPGARFTSSRPPTCAGCSTSAARG